MHENEDRLHATILSPVPWEPRPCRPTAERLVPAKPVSGRSQPCVDGRDKASRLVSDRGPVVERGHRAVPLEAVGSALDRMALAVVVRVETRRPAAAGAEFPAVARLVGLAQGSASGIGVGPS
ncbi:hypothetical protein GCM10009551_016420 [Nocardiopsis tropica]